MANGHGHHGAANLTPEQQKQMIEQETAKANDWTGIKALWTYEKY